MRCTARTAQGAPCKNTAMEGTDLCGSHLRIAHRKTNLTTALTDQLVGLLRGGVPVRTAIATVNLPKSTYYVWMESPDPLHVRFAERIREAQAFGEATLVSRIANASHDNWAAAAWLLERTVPERYARLSQRAQAPAPEQPADPFSEFVADELAARRSRPA